MEPERCPHCGGQPVMLEIPPHTHQFAKFMPDHEGSWVIEDCGCGAGMIGATREGVLARWNRRTPPPATSQPRGCVCPPGAEATCQGWGCPRRRHDYARMTGIGSAPPAPPEATDER